MKYSFFPLDVRLLGNLFTEVRLPVSFYYIYLKDFYKNKLNEQPLQEHNNNNN